ncbi:MAG: hypothetical protein JW795_09675, partial [Chitinivibrionales bacterium]|nr:hypothetical protein [Chitinivibrionales bacterium]
YDDLRSVSLSVDGGSLYRLTLTTPLTVQTSTNTLLLKINDDQAAIIESWPSVRTMLKVAIDDSLAYSDDFGWSLNNSFSPVVFDTTGIESLQLITSQYDADKNELLFVYNRALTSVDSTRRMALSTTNGSFMVIIPQPWQWRWVGSSNDSIAILVPLVQSRFIERLPQVATSLEVACDSNVFFVDKFGNPLIHFLMDVQTVYLPDTTAAEPVTDVVGLAVNCSTATLSWEPSISQDCDSIRVCVADTGMPSTHGDGWSKKSVDNATRTLTLSGLPPYGNQIFCALFSKDDAGNWSPYSGCASVIVLMPDGVAPENRISVNLTTQADSLICASFDMPVDTGGKESAAGYAGFYYCFTQNMSKLTEAFFNFIPYEDTTVVFSQCIQSGLWYCAWYPVDSANNKGVLRHDSVTIKNSPPKLFCAASYTLAEDRFWQMQDFAYDRNQDSVELFVMASPIGLSVNSFPPRISWQPANRDVGVHTVRIFGRDGTASSDTVTVKLTVVNSNDTPVIVSAQLADTILTDTVTVMTVVIADVDATDSITAIVDAATPWVSAIQTHEPTGAWRFLLRALPTASDTGQWQLQVTFFDSAKASVSVKHSLFVQRLDRSPKTSIARKEHAGAAVRYTVRATGIDTAFTFAGQLAALTGGFVKNSTTSTGIFTFYPLSDGRYSFSVYATDKLGQSDPSPSRDTIVIENVSTRRWAADSLWHMMSIPARSINAAAIKSCATLARWDEAQRPVDIYKYYQRSEQIASLSAGSAYWCRFTAPFTVTLDTASVMKDSCIIALQKAEFGWNQIASPYPYPVQWQSTLTLWQWNETALDFEESSGVLLPYKGYWVNADRPTTVTLYPQPCFPVAGRQKMATVYYQNGREWSLNLEMTSNLNSDADNVFGVSRFASDGYDDLDKAEPPRMGKEPFVYFIHPQWKRNITMYARDMRHDLTDETAIFQIGISSCPPEVSNLYLRIKGIPDNNRLFVFFASPSNISAYSDVMPVIIPAADKEQYRTIFVTTDRDFLKKFPVSFNMGNPYPNPCRPRTTINYTLPYRWENNGLLNASAYDVRILVYDSRGRVVKELLNRRQSPGSYSAVWFGKTESERIVASGAYFLRLSAATFSSVKKVIVLR